MRRAVLVLMFLPAFAAADIDIWKFERVDVSELPALQRPGAGAGPNQICGRGACVEYKVAAASASRAPVAAPPVPDGPRFASIEQPGRAALSESPKKPADKPKANPTGNASAGAAGASAKGALDPRLLQPK